MAWASAFILMYCSRGMVMVILNFTPARDRGAGAMPESPC